MGQALCCNRFDQNEKKSVRFFLAGTSQGGKSAIIRQLKCLCKDEPKNFKLFNNCGGQRYREEVFTHVELSELRRRIKFNVLTAVYNILQQAKRWGYPVLASERADRLKSAMEAEMRNKSGIRNIKDSLVEDLIRVLEDSSVQRTLCRSYEFLPEFRMTDGSFHYLNPESIRRIFDKHQILTSADIVYSYSHTSAVKSYKFEVKKNRVDFHDMGGHTSEMINFPDYIQHWHRGCDERNRSFLLYIISLTDFNVHDTHNPDFTSLDKSIRTLEIMLSMRCVNNLPVLVLFNKKDTFSQLCMELLKSGKGRLSLLEYFGEFLDDGKRESISQGVVDNSCLKEAMIKKLSKTLSRKRSGKVLYYSFCEATDAKDIKMIFEALTLKDVNELTKLGLIKCLVI